MGGGGSQREISWGSQFCSIVHIMSDDTSLPRWPPRVDPLHEAPVGKAAAGGAGDLADKVFLFSRKLFSVKTKTMFLGLYQFLDQAISH